MAQLSVHSRHLIYVVGLTLSCSKHDVIYCVYAFSALVVFVLGVQKAWTACQL